MLSSANSELAKRESDPQYNECFLDSRLRVLVLGEKCERAIWVEFIQNQDKIASPVPILRNVIADDQIYPTTNIARASRIAIPRTSSRALPEGVVIQEIMK